ncbi:hypothetical protein CEXT_82281 [Caerostris extrusa]|uniref:Uncharacterized protein n=1 Tax=Caerostris extrusa TaxID=172846 RepID=A0AAV4TRA4_CAEEX|nr:hypothetical protein CEXT_82281 [Caerostris extrusa]
MNDFGISKLSNLPPKEVNETERPPYAQKIGEIVFKLINLFTLFEDCFVQENLFRVQVLENTKKSDSS